MYAPWKRRFILLRFGFNLIAISTYMKHTYTYVCEFSSGSRQYVKLSGNLGVLSCQDRRVFEIVHYISICH